MQPASSCSFPRKLGLEAVEPIEKALQSFHGFLSVRTTKVATTVSTTVPTIVRKIASSGSVPPLTWIVLAYACVARTRTGSDTNSLSSVGSLHIAVAFSFGLASWSVPARQCALSIPGHWKFRFLVAFPPVSDLLLFAKHLFVAAFRIISRAVIAYSV